MISEREVQAYRRDGVIVVPEVLGKETLAEVRTVIAEDDVIADIGDFLDPAGELPCLAPDFLDFPVVPSLVEIASDIDIAGH